MCMSCPGFSPELQTHTLHTAGISKGQSRIFYLCTHVNLPYPPGKWKTSTQVLRPKTNEVFFFSNQTKYNKVFKYRYIFF